MKIGLSLIFLVLGSGPLTSLAETPDEGEQRWTAHHNTVLKYNMMATGDVVKKYGKSFRVVAWLKECKLDALANAITPTNTDIQGVVIQYLRKQPDGERYLWDVLAGVMSSVNYYQFGFNETTEGIRAMMGETFCKKAAEEANDVMRERQPAK